ncbi:MAG: serine/threonine protein kinase [Planctomycetota bacterium]|nr:MAG: serine/threonine protein kinase [Planctomycetota bacterium]
MVELSAEQFAQRAFDLNLIDERQLHEVWGQIGTNQLSVQEFQQLLLRREFLTNYQTERLLRGERAGFFYGDYKVLYLIGSGTFARVYRACHKDTGEIVALKVLRRRYADDPEQADRFYREGKLGASLQHPNIVPIMEVVSHRDVHFLVMEFIEGRNLREFIKIRKKFDVAQATRLTADIAAGLNYAFLRGVCHRDLKMSNVLVSSKGQGMLLDFGLAAGEDDVTDSPNPRTIDYAGLERATGVRKDDQRSDIYFLGCIYYHMLTGTPPVYETKDRIQRLSRSRFTEVVPILKADPELPRPVANVVTKAMQLDVDERYQTPGQMLQDLKQVMQRLDEPYEEAPEGEESSAPAPAAAPEPPRRTLMFVESNVQLQDVIRTRLKNNGYRVLVTADPQRALSRFADGNAAADCVIFSTGELGQSALEAFNKFAESEHTAKIPAVLLLGEHHKGWKKHAKLGSRRVSLAMPIKLRQFREVLAKLVPPVEKEQAAD